MLVFVAFALKLLIVAALARALRSRCPDALGAWLAGWVIATALIFVFFLTLSLADLLTRPVFYAVMVVCAVIAASTMRRRAEFIDIPSDGRILLAFFALFWIAFATRALLFQDFSSDAPAVHMARIGLWMHYQTILVHMPALFTTVFSAGWNGELIGLYYGLATGDLQGPIFGNVEVLLVTFFASVWVSRLCGASLSWAYAVAGLVALCPAVLGVATTVKGDLLAAGAGILALGWVILLRADRSGFTAAALVTCAALSAGAHLTGSIVMVAICLYGVFVAGIQPFLRANALTACVPLAAVFLSRYVVNMVVYANPIQRIDGEGPEPGLHTFIENAHLILSRSLQFSMPVSDGHQYAWHIAGGLGLTGLAFVTAASAAVWARRRQDIPLLSIVVFALGVSSFAVPHYWWGFRYFLPGVLGILVLVLSRSEVGPRWIITGIATVASAFNISYLTWGGELNGNTSFTYALSQQMGMQPVERTFLAWDLRRKYSEYARLRLDRANSLTFVVFQNDREPGRDILPFIGSKAQHRVILVRSQQDVAAAARLHQPDFVAVAKPGGKAVPKSIRDAIVAAGFIWIVDNPWRSIFARADIPEARIGGLFQSAIPPVFKPQSQLWVSGAYTQENYQGDFFRWIQASSSMSVPLIDGAACILLEVFAASHSDAQQIVNIRGDATPTLFDLRGTSISQRHKIRILVNGAGREARIEFIATMPVTIFPRDPRRIAYGVTEPPQLAPASACH
ncbi:MAG: hypothetical protein KIT16_12885 [Rhodospirillaceae bacterium]|nr:hypothetical protein [Rhodospirillaceae bacterium]